MHGRIPRLSRKPLIYSSHRRKPVPSALNFLDSGLRRNDGLSFNQRFPCIHDKVKIAAIAAEQLVASC